MKETKFIQQNKEKWAKFEKLSKSDKKVNPKESSELFTEITEDLSYARTFYKRRSVRVYLNQLSQSVFFNLYKKKGGTWKKFVNFWKTDLPIELYRSRVNLLVAFLSFSVWIIVGALSQHYNPEFVRFILGDFYVDQTLERIESGDPMGIYGTSEQAGMFLRITTNNIRVSFMAFAFGFLGTIGTHYLLLVNGTMLGAFQYWFLQKGLLLTSFLTIWIHGAFEISAIVIAGAAGITFGKGLLFPGSFTRAQALQLSGRRGMKILASLIPVFIMAGFLESFVTRNYLLFSDVAKWGIIILSFGLIIFYYLIYPIIVAKRNPEKLKENPLPRFVKQKKESLYKIRTSSENFTHGMNAVLSKFKVFSFYLIRIGIPLFVIAFCLQIYFYKDFLSAELAWYDISAVIFGIGQFFNPFVFSIWVIGITAIASASLLSITAEKSIPIKEIMQTSFKLIFPIGILYFIFIFILNNLSGAAMLLVIPLLPFCMYIPSSIVFSTEGSYFKKIGKGIQIGTSLWGSSVGLFLMCMGISAIVLMAIVGFSPTGNFDMIPGLGDLIVIVLEPLINYLFDSYLLIYTCLIGFILILGVAFVMPIFFASFSYQYFSSIEKEEAIGLKEDYELFGTRSRVYEKKVDFDDE